MTPHEREYAALCWTSHERAEQRRLRGSRRLQDWLCSDTGRYQGWKQAMKLSDSVRKTIRRHCA